VTTQRGRAAAGTAAPARPRGAEALCDVDGDAAGGDAGKTPRDVDGDTAGGDTGEAPAGVTTGALGARACGGACRG
jgi:hypothetical protein